MRKTHLTSFFSAVLFYNVFVSVVKLQAQWDLSIMHHYYTHYIKIALCQIHKTSPSHFSHSLQAFTNTSTKTHASTRERRVIEFLHSEVKSPQRERYISVM